MAASPQPVPEVVVFRGGEVCPAASAQVSVCPHPQVRSVDMRMRTVPVDEIGEPEELFDDWLMLDERVYVYDPCHCGKTSGGDGDLVQ